MELKKGYIQTEVGIIPEDWNAEYIKKFASITTGGSDTQDKIDDGIYPFYVRSQKVEKINQYTFDGEAVLTSGDGVGVGKIFHYASGKFDFHQRVYCIYNFNNVDGKYFYLQFSSRFFDRVMSMTAKSSVDSVRMEMIADMKIPLPPTLNEQEAIAQVLSDSDALIQALEKKIAKKELIKKGVMQKLLSPKEEWKIKPLADIGESIIGLTYSPADVSPAGTLVLRSSNVQGNKLAFEDNVFVNMELPSRVIVRENDLLICVRNGSKNLIGKCALINKNVEGSAFGAFMSVFRSEFAEFVFQVFQSSIIQKQIEEVMGATINQITNKDLASFSIPFPPKQEQIRIAKILSDMDNEIDQLEQKLSKYKQVKQGMMQQLLTGKIRLVKPKNNMQEDNLAIAAEPNESYQRK